MRDLIKILFWFALIVLAPFWVMMQFRGTTQILDWRGGLGGFLFGAASAALLTVILILGDRRND